METLLGIEAGRGCAPSSYFGFCLARKWLLASPEVALARLANTFWQARGWLLANSSLAVSFEIFSLGIALQPVLLLSGNTLTGLNLGHAANPSGLRVRAILACKTAIYRSTTILFIMQFCSLKKQQVFP